MHPKLAMAALLLGALGPVVAQPIGDARHRQEQERSIADVIKALGEALGQSARKN